MITEVLVRLATEWKEANSFAEREPLIGLFYDALCEAGYPEAAEYHMSKIGHRVPCGGTCNVIESILNQRTALGWVDWTLDKEEATCRIDNARRRRDHPNLYKAKYPCEESVPSDSSVTVPEKHERNP